MLGEKGQWQRAAESNEESNLRNNEPKRESRLKTLDLEMTLVRIIALLLI